MIGEQSGDMFMIPCRARSMRALPIAGISLIAECKTCRAMGRVAAHGTGSVEIQVRAQHDPALVGLADVKMPHAEAHDMVEHALRTRRDEGLQEVASIGWPRQTMAGTSFDRPATTIPSFFARFAARVVPTPAPRPPAVSIQMVVLCPTLPQPGCPLCEISPAPGPAAGRGEPVAPLPMMTPSDSGFGSASRQ